MSSNVAVRAGSEPLCFFLTNDFSGLSRGRGFPAQDLARYLDSGCGWVHANQALTPFGPIGDGHPFGPIGDLRLRADPATEVRYGFDDGAQPLHFLLCDIVDYAGAPWDCCPRSFLKAAIGDLRRETGLIVRASFEHEFTIKNFAEIAPPFSYRAYRLAEKLCGEIVAAMRAAGAGPEMILPEYGAGQMEITMAPADALKAADNAVVVRELVRELGRRNGLHATFAPKVSPTGVGNGVHVHFGLSREDGTPVNYDRNGAGLLSATLAQFCAGVLRHLPALIALTAPSGISHLRLQPHHWSAAFTCIGSQNREAALRICPAPRQSSAQSAHHVEFRAADGCASPYLALGALIRAGLDGIRRQAPLPKLLDVDPSSLSDAQRRDADVRALPGSVPEALAEVDADSEVRGWFSDDFWRCYRAMKHAELNLLAGLSAEEMCERYSRVY
ncbi:glutamine synthetase family protein [Burkholderia oklahomensis]|uniref:Glutamine synthetase, catalytic domain protein n=1 Tax=Burkholderia oklahomensis TaxID=342113 RepID=A0AAI8FRK1_9BURK|nr:glutamine synthetase [Burkholderia oklahomensis]AIO70032.1 glutamine synthetase, catalytic domain protein [Burkholderia oklahomensis]AOI39225.1 glutamine synthetase [Burkholderia oklahomensis EO147]KUY51715.1 glutamine synthetase [Burkholderia oklahomensis EO147]QPS40422.1 glutamine synthetase [Burkholderia oklahomensis]